MDFESWSVDLESGSAVHVSGFKVVIEGSAASPSGVHPTNFPKGLSAVDQARLVRCGLEAIVKSAKTSTRKGPAPSVVVTNARSKNKPDRPVLSLRKKA